MYCSEALVSMSDAGVNDSNDLALVANPRGIKSTLQCDGECAVCINLELIARRSCEEESSSGFVLVA